MAVAVPILKLCPLEKNSPFLLDTLYVRSRMIDLVVNPQIAPRYYWFIFRTFFYWLLDPSRSPGWVASRFPTEELIASFPA